MGSTPPPQRSNGEDAAEVDVGHQEERVQHRMLAFALGIVEEQLRQHAQAPEHGEDADEQGERNE